VRCALYGWQAARGAPERWCDGARGYGDDADWFFRAELEAPQDGELLFEGLATLAEVSVDGAVVAESESMWLPVRVPVAGGAHEVRVHCHALAPRLAEHRRPRARWRQKVAADGNLRFFRTTLLGRAPGFAPGPPVVGLWRPAWYVCDEPGLALRPRLEGDDGVLAVRANVPDGALLRVGAAAAALTGGAAELRLPGVKRWWPHTHGEPVLHEATLEVDGTVVASRRVGFRALETRGDVLRDGLSLRVNGVGIFVRGALWAPPPAGQERATLERARDAGLNAVRLPGTGVYESAGFHDLCDELGLLVWQDLMFANLDYPFADPGFHALATAEVDALAGVVGGRPSLCVVCGNSEIEQQVAMLGLDPALGRGGFFGEEVPARLAAAGVDAVYLPSAPCGATRPLRADEGVSNWFGVGGYRRPVGDVRAAGVRFASECLAIANVGDGGPAPEDPAWKAGVPGDVGADWDFDDVRDFYLAALYGVDPEALRSADPKRWLALSRSVSGDVMAEVFGEWRRSDSPCAGGLVLWLRDLVPGAGWGLLDHTGAPKAVLGALRRVLAPVAVWTTDEGLGGVAVHVANDGPEPLAATVRIALYRDGEHRIAEASAAVEVPPHGAWTGDVEALLGHWVDASYAYRFGPPAHDLLVAALEGPGSELLSQSERFPAGRSPAAHSAEALGISARLEDDAVRISSTRALIGARLLGCEAAEDGFLVEPGHERIVAVRAAKRLVLTALNLDTPLELAP